LTVAVLVDNLRNTNDNGDVKETPFTPEQIDNMSKLCAMQWATMKKRGDSINVGTLLRPAPRKAAMSCRRRRCGNDPWCRDIASCDWVDRVVER